VFNPLQLFANGEAGVFYDPGDLTAEKVAWRRNLLTWSEQFDNAAWVKSNTTITANAAVAPDGTTTADKLIKNNGATSAEMYGPNVASVVAGTQYTFSLFAKAAEYTFVKMAGGGTSYGNKGITVNLTTGAIAATDSGWTGSVVNAGNGWFRIIGTATAAATETGNLVVYSGTSASFNDTGNGSNGLFAWGAQLERGTTASAYQRITDFTSDFLAAFPTHALYQDAAGTTPVTVLGQPVGLALDKSRGALANVGAEVVTNGDFSSGTGWNAPAGWAIGSGVATATATNASLTGTGFPVVAGRTYRVSFDVVTFGGGTLFVRVGTGTATTFTSTGTKVCFLTASSTTGIEFYGGGVTCTLDNVSVREVPGVHKIQPTSASREALDARVNLLTYSEQFDNAAWSLQTATVAANSTVAPDGTTTADTLSASATEGFLFRSFTAAATPYVWSIFAKANTTSTVRLDAVTGGFAAGASCTFTLTGSGAAGTVTHYGTTTGFVASIVSVGNGWYRCALTGTATATTWFHETMVAGSGNSVFAWGADLRLATDAAYPYQRVVTATDYADVGVPRSFLHDGFDDGSFTASSLDLSGTDKVTVWAGVYKNSDAARGIVVELGTGATDIGVFNLNAPNASLGNFSFVSAGGVVASAAASLAAPASRVLAGVGEINTPLAALRLNGAQAAAVTTSQGSGNYLNAVLYMGRRNNASLPFNGKVYTIIIRGGVTDAATLALTERYVGSRMGIVL
jgi:hypothetical protein